MKSILTASLLTLTATLVHAAIPRPLGLHQFDDDTLNNSIFGGSAASATNFTATFANDTIGGQTARVLTVPSLSSITQRLVLPTPGGPNGGGSFLNNYSVVMDVKLPALPASGQFAALFQTNTGNTNDAEVHLNSSGQIILSGVTNQISIPASVAANTWTRIAITCGNSTSNGPLTVRAYLNGVLVFENANESHGGRYSLDPSALLFADNNGETVPISCNSIGFWNARLTSDQIAALGSPSAVGLTSLLVENANPSGADSLTAAVTAAANAATASGPDSIGFVSSLSGQALTLASQIVINDNSPVTIDATALPGGFTISGNNATRLFFMDSGNSLLLRGLTLTGGNGTGSGNNNFGGAINNNGGVLTLAHCTLSGNSASESGGAIFNNNGFLNLSNSTFFENSATVTGGAISNSGRLTIERSTLHGNSARAGGGAIQHFSPEPLTITASTLAHNTARFEAGAINSVFTSPVVLTHCTITGNSVTVAAGNGVGGVRGVPTGFITVRDSIIAGNTDANFPGTPNIAAGFIDQGTNLTSGDPKLSPLGYFGGPVQTMHPLIGSPAIDAAGSTDPGGTDPGGTDARGFPRFIDGKNTFGTQTNVLLDIGAVEAGPLRTVAFSSNTGSSGTLRSRINQSTEPGARLAFFTSNFPSQAVGLTEGQLEIPAGRSLFIDASNLSAPVTISGQGNSRVFNIPATATVAMHSVRIVGGKAPDGTGIFNTGSETAGENGGGILNAGALSLFSSTLSGNRTGNGADSNLSSTTRGGHGGGIFSSGPLNLTACTLSGNITGNGGGDFTGIGGGADGGSGGGIFCDGPLSLTACTLAANITGNGGRGGGDLSRGGNGGSGGGIFSNGSLSVSTSTFSANIAGNGANNNAGSGGPAGAGGSGGAIFQANQTPCRLTACTITGHRAGSGGVGTQAGFNGDGAGISGLSGNITLQHCLMTDNLGANGGFSDILAQFITYEGSNLLSVIPATSLTNQSGPSPIIAPNPLLAPLANYGGPTETMALRPGSPARNAATGNTARITDQRGFPMIGVPDIGAYEAGNALLTNFNAFIWETLPATATPAQATATADFDGDGTSNEFEFLSRTSPADASSRFAITTQPISVTINRGQTATFSVAASGNAPSFQWFLGNPGDTTNPITGATSATFQTTPLTANTLFWVRVRSGASNLDSASATATVISPPLITTAPKSKTIKKGKKAKLTVIASGSTLTFQWFRGISGNTKSPIKNAKAATFKTPKLTATTLFWVRITNNAGTVNSKTVAVKVR